MELIEKYLLTFGRQQQANLGIEIAKVVNSARPVFTASSLKLRLPMQPKWLLRIKTGVEVLSGIFIVARSMRFSLSLSELDFNTHENRLMVERMVITSWRANVLFTSTGLFVTLLTYIFEKTKVKNLNFDTQNLARCSKRMETKFALWTIVFQEPRKGGNFLLLLTALLF